MTRRVWGYVYEQNDPLAAYFVEWTPGHADLATFDLIIGKWGSESNAADGAGVSLAFRHLEGGPAFMVVDCGDRAIAKSPLVRRALTRGEVIGTPAANLAFKICDWILLKDQRVVHLSTG
jgi:hypothetical protein